MILITGVITSVVEFCGSIVVNIFLIFRSAVRFGTLALEIFLSTLVLETCYSHDKEKILLCGSVFKSLSAYGDCYVHFAQKWKI